MSDKMVVVAGDAELSVEVFTEDGQWTNPGGDSHVAVLAIPGRVNRDGVVVVLSVSRRSGAGDGGGTFDVLARALRGRPAD